MGLLDKGDLGGRGRGGCPSDANSEARQRGFDGEAVCSDDGKL
jgi:hypothetical protein